MKVVLYSEYFFPTTGGVQTNVFELASGLSEWQRDKPSDRMDVTVVTCTAETTPQDASWPFRVVRRPSPLRLLRVLRNADVIHVAGPAMLPMVIGLILRKPVVITYHGYQSVCPNGLLIYGPDRSVCPGHFMAGRFRNCLRCNSGEIGWFGSLRSLVLQFPRRWLASSVTLNIAPSRHVAYRASLPRTKLIYHGVPNGTIASDIQPATANGVPCFAYVGRLVPEKGVAVLLGASHVLMQRGSRFCIRIIGDGPQRYELEEMTRKLGLSDRVEFVGSLAQNAVSDSLATAAAVVIPSIWEEVAPLVALEQMMQGRLVIASDIGGLGEEVDRFGLKFPAGDVDALASCMSFAVSNGQAVDGLRNSARRHASELHTEDRMVREHADLYRSLAR